MIEKLRVTAYQPWGAALGVVPAVSEIKAVFPLNDLSTGRLVVATGAPRADWLTRLPAEVALEAKIGGEWVEPRNCRFFALKSTVNQHSPEVVTLDLMSIGVSLRWATVWEATPGDKDLKRQFDSVTPGLVMSRLFSEAKARKDNGIEWAPGLSWGFTGERDSAGRAWPRNARRTLDRSDDLLKTLSWYSDKGAAHWWLEGRELVMLASQEPNQPTARLRVHASTTIPVTESIEDIATTAAFSGKDGLFFTQSNPAAVNALGRVERWSEQGNVTQPGTAQLYLDRLLLPGAKPATETRREWTAGVPGQAYLWEDYQVGDWVQTDSEALRIVEAQISQNKDGVISGAEALGTRMQSLAEKLARRTTDLSSGQVGGESGRPSPAPGGATGPAEAIRGLTVAAVKTTDAQGVTRSSVEVSWNPAPTPVEVWARDTGGWYLAAVVESGAACVFDGPPTGELTARARVAAKNDSPAGPWSGQVTVNIETGEALVAKPAGAAATSKLGILYVTWDGTSEAGAFAPGGKAQLQVTASETPAQPDGDAQVQGKAYSAPAVVAIPGLTVGKPYWVWVRLVDAQGRTSAWAAAGETQIRGVSGPDIEAGTLTANQIDVGSLTAGIANLLTLTAGQVSGASADFVKAFIHNLNGNKAVFNQLWADMIKGRRISADNLDTGIAYVSTLYVGGYKIDPSALRGMGTINNPVEYGQSELNGSEIRTGSVKINSYGNGWIPRCDAQRFSAEQFTLGTPNGDSISGWNSFIYQSGGARFNGALDVDGALTAGQVSTSGWVRAGKLVETSTAVSKEYAEPVRDLTALLDVEPVAYRSKAGMDEWRAQFGEAGPSRPLQALPERQAGWVAEELDAAGLGVLVGHNPETGEPIGVEYSRVTVALWQIAKQQAKRIDELDKRLAALEENPRDKGRLLKVWNG